MSPGLMLHIREDWSSEELQRLTKRNERKRGLNLHVLMSRKPHLHVLSTESPPHVVLRAVCEQGYHTCLVDL